MHTSKMGAMIAGAILAQAAGDIGKIVEIQAGTRDHLAISYSRGKSGKQPHSRGGVRRQQRAAAKLRNQKRHRAACKKARAKPANRSRYTFGGRRMWVKA